jgi:hypothetical protein
MFVDVIDRINILFTTKVSGLLCSYIVGVGRLTRENRISQNLLLVEQGLKTDCQRKLSLFSYLSCFNCCYCPTFSCSEDNYSRN